MRELIHQIPNKPREGPGAEPKNLAPHLLEYSLALPGGSSLPTHSLQMVIPSHTAQASPLPLPPSLQYKQIYYTRLKELLSNLVLVLSYQANNH